MKECMICNIEKNEDKFEKYFDCTHDEMCITCFILCVKNNILKGKILCPFCRKNIINDEVIVYNENIDIIINNIIAENQVILTEHQVRIEEYYSLVYRQEIYRPRIYRREVVDILRSDDSLSLWKKFKNKIKNFFSISYITN